MKGWIDVYIRKLKSRDGKLRENWKPIFAICEFGKVIGVGFGKGGEACLG